MNAKQNISSWPLVLVISILGITVLAQSAAMISLHKKVDALSKTDAENVTQVQQDKTPFVTQSKPNTNSTSIDQFFEFDDNWDPFMEMQAMRESIDHMFGNAFNRFHNSDNFGGLLENYAFSPDMNIEDKGDHFLVTVDLPGYEDSKIDVKVEDQMLTLSGTVESETEEQNDNGQILRQERQSGKFYRTITLPGPVNTDKMTTKNKKGVLYITLPKKSEGSK